MDEKGQVCLPIVAVENWKPATKMEQVTWGVVDFYYLGVMKWERQWGSDDKKITWPPLFRFRIVEKNLEI